VPVPAPPACPAAPAAAGRGVSAAGRARRRWAAAGCSRGVAWRPRGCARACASSRPSHRELTTPPDPCSPRPPAPAPAPTPAPAPAPAPAAARPPLQRLQHPYRRTWGAQARRAGAADRPENRRRRPAHLHGCPTPPPAPPPPAPPPPAPPPSAPPPPAPPPSAPAQGARGGAGGNGSKGVTAGRG
jgi:hypothetical protein